MKHTPGPWVARLNPENDRWRHSHWIDGPDSIGNAASKPICEVRNYDVIGENNAHLIAAAPMMYAALKTVRRTLDDAKGTKAEGLLRLQDYINLDAAIAAAEENV